MDRWLLRTACQLLWENKLLSIYKLLKREDLSHQLHHFLSSFTAAFQKKPNYSWKIPKLSLRPPLPGDFSFTPRDERPN